MNGIKKIYWIGLGLILLVAPIGVSFVQGGTAGNEPCEGGSLCNPLKVGSISEFLVLILNVVITFAFPVIILMVIYSGFLFVKAQGNPEELAKAKTAIMWTLIGATVILGAFVITAAIGGTVQELSTGTTTEVVDDDTVALPDDDTVSLPE